MIYCLLKKLNLRLCFSVCVLTTLCLSIVFSFAQKPTKQERRLYKKCRKALANEDYSNAKLLYTDLLKLNPENDVYNFETGLSYYFSEYERTKSIPFFENALKYSTKDTIPELFFYLGKAYQFNYQFIKAKETLTHFKKFIKNPPSGKLLLNETDHSINQAEYGLELSQAKNNNIKIKNLGNPINTTSREYAPVLKKQDNVILFTSRRPQNKGRKAVDLLPYEDIYVAKKIKEDNWELITNNNDLEKYLPKNFNTKKHDAGVIYSSDEKTLYTYKKDVLWKSEYKDHKWTDLEKLSNKINNSKFNVPSITISPDGKTIFFVATKKDGIGGKDIYTSKVDENGNWSTPELLSTEINTPKDEDGPFMSSDGKFLYFSSKGHDGMGGYDFFRSKIVDGKPTQPENMGIPINSPFDDIYIMIDNKEESGFFSSDRDGGFGGMDIYGFDLSCENIKNTEIRGIVYNYTNQLPLDAKIKLVDTENSIEIATTQTLSTTGKFLLVAPPEKSYDLVIESPTFKKQIINLTIPKQCDFYPLFIELAVEKNEKDSEINQTLTARTSFFNRENVLTQPIDVSSINKEVPLIKDENDKDFESDKQLMAFTRNIDTSTTDLAYQVIQNNITYKQPIADTSALEFQHLFAYNDIKINTSNIEFISFKKKILNKIAAYGKVEIIIESSASRVPTKTYQSNINLTSRRGDKAKEQLMNLLKENGVTNNQINFESINSIVSGPKYIEDYKNTEKYKPYQYVKFIIK